MRIIDLHHKTIEAPLVVDGAPPMQYIDVTPAATRFWMEKKEYYDLSDDFPCVVPPFQLTWMEYEAPRSYDPRMAGLRFGCLAFSVPIKRDSWREALVMDALKQLLRLAGSPMLYRGNNKETEEYKKNLLKRAAGNDPVEWMAVYRVVGMDRRNKLHEMTNLAVYLDENGQIVNDLHLIYRYDFNGLSSEEALATQVTAMPFLFALSLCHAKNVTIDDEPLPPKVRQRRQNKGYRVDFKILKIHPYQQRKSAESQNSNVMPLHLVRGHFKDYRKGDGLFGKYKKLVWFDMHTRGNPENGLVVKDYEA